MRDAEKKKAWVVAVNMGFGHQRAAHPLMGIAEGNKIFNANDYPGMPKKDKSTWDNSQKFYEFISNFAQVPILGPISFKIFDYFQKIDKFDPRKDLTRPNLSVRGIFSLIRKDWGKDFVEKLKEKNLNLVSTFFTPAFMADYNNYPGKIFCLATDTDIARTWAPINPEKSKIIYFSPTLEASRRLRAYGVKEENIIQTGFPLPKNNLGNENFDIARTDTAKRILNLDPTGFYRNKSASLIEKYLGTIPDVSDRPLTIMFSIGGAGAQSKLSFQIIKSLKGKIKEGKIRLFLAIGSKTKVWYKFDQEITSLGLENTLGSGIRIIKSKNAFEYFDDFNKALRESDILWTKPSELSFYAALGIPIIIAPPIGSQEDFNKEWLIKHEAGIPQKNPQYVDRWLFDYLKNGAFAEAAMQGFVELEKNGTYNIEKIIQEN